MIDVTGLGKSYGTIQALHDVSFHVDAGEIIGLLGPNGAGKTTMMKILTGYLQPSDGKAVVDGLDVVSDALEVQRRIGYLPENAPLYPELSVQRYLKLIAELRQIPPSQQAARLTEALRATGLADHRTRLIGQLSKGYRQRVGLAQAILHRPRLLILDEPTIGLDPTQIVEVRHLIHSLARQSTVLLSTHILSEVEAVCDRVIILLNGEVRADAHLADLEASSDAILVLAEGTPDVRTALQSLHGVHAVEVVATAEGTSYRVRGMGKVDLRPALFDLAREKGWPLTELRRDHRTLETVFNELVTTAAVQGKARFGESAGAAEGRAA
ncbi:MAG TPA: ATP-binding cassette domain-containing protein [Anaerolineae bacterium]|nr:ATP-binding cassette domain-containing protein [Anaerolineae bacterium]